MEKEGPFWENLQIFWIGTARVAPTRAPTNHDKWSP
jgi:hypothetical protein